MAVKSVFPRCVRTMHILPNLVTYEELDESVRKTGSMLPMILVYTIPYECKRKQPSQILGIS